MLIVVALVGLLVGMITPSFVRMARITKVTNASTRLFNGLLRGRAIAMRKGRPVIFKVNVTATNMQFIACLDADSAITPGADSPTTLSCASATGDAPLTGADNPFNPFMQLDINDTRVVTNNVSLGYPALVGATYTAQATNLGGTGVYWFGYDTSGKLIPNGPSISTAIYSSDITGLARLPAGSTTNLGGPEFYFAEFNAAANNAYPKRHVYRKVELTVLGGARVMNWTQYKTPNQWTGVQ